MSNTNDSTTLRVTKSDVDELDRFSKHASTVDRAAEVAVLWSETAGRSVQVEGHVVSEVVGALQSLAGECELDAEVIERDGATEVRTSEWAVVVVGGAL